MILLYTVLILLLSIKSRNYVTLEEIYKNISITLHTLPLNFVINGTNDYSYNFNSVDILYYLNAIYISDPKREINFLNQNIKIVFNLNIYEYTSELFDFSSEDIKYSEKIIVDMLFKSLKFYQEYDDFSFAFKYEIDDFDNDIKIHYENIDKLNSFKYLFFEDKSSIYDNKTLNDFIKINILKSLKQEVYKSLVYYPECDALAYFKYIIQYLKNQLFQIDFRINGIIYSITTINKYKILKFDYNEIIKDNRTIIFKNINVTSYLQISDMNLDDYENERTWDETISFMIDYISINQYLHISYGKTTISRDYALDALKVVVNLTIDSIAKKNK